MLRRLSILAALVLLTHTAAARKPVAPVHARAPVAQSRIGEKLFVLWGGADWPATVIGAGDGDKVRIHYDNYGAEWDEDVGPERVEHTTTDHARTRHVGERLFVTWGGALWPARVLAVTKAGLAKIRYEGYGEEWDETVGADRIGFLTTSGARIR